MLWCFYLCRGIWLPTGSPAFADQVIPDDLIVQGSMCIGLDCVDNESFGFDTLRLKENNTRIKFQDTSANPGFPGNDWTLVANDIIFRRSKFLWHRGHDGGPDDFRRVRRAPSASLWVNSLGNVGLGTENPLLKLHLTKQLTRPASGWSKPTRGGFTAQTWDIAGNEANFFIRDLTGGSRLPFRIRPGAPTSSIDHRVQRVCRLRDLVADRTTAHHRERYASKACPAAAPALRPMPRAICPAWSAAGRHWCNRLVRANRLGSASPPTAPR